MNKTSGCLDNGYQTFVNGYIYTFDSDQNGWHIRRENRGERDFPTISPIVNGFPVLSMGNGKWGGKSVYGTFEGCPDRKMPKAFVIPDTVENMERVFSESALRVIHKNFKFPKNVKNLSFAFFECCIRMIPDGLKIPEGALDATGMFELSPNLHTVGAGFFIPDSVIFADAMFAGCAELTTIPEDFSLCSHTSREDFFDGTPLCNCTVKLRKPKYKKIDEKSGCLDNGYQTFINGYIYTFDSDKNGWHIQREDRGEGDFPIILPVVLGFPVLSMGCERWGGNLVEGTFVESEDKKMPKNFVIPDTVENMECAFFESELRVIQNDFTLPKNVKNLSFAFFGCCIKKIPENFKIPEGALDTSSMFGENFELQTIGNGFFIPDSVKYADGMFADCANLTTIPEDFSLCSYATRKDFFDGTAIKNQNVKLREPKR